MPPPEEETVDDPVVLASSYFPAAMGLTLAVEPGAQQLIVHIAAATYESQKRSREVDGEEKVYRVWCRQPLELEPIRVDLGGAQEGEETDMESS